MKKVKPLAKALTKWPGVGRVFKFFFSSAAVVERALASIRPRGVENVSRELEGDRDCHWVEFSDCDPAEHYLVVYGTFSGLNEDDALSCA